MNIEEAIKLLKQEPDFSLSYYKREYAIDLLLKDYEKLKDELKEERALNVEALKTLKECVHKDKIKEKIKELESHIWKDGYMTKFDKYAIHYLKELLGE